MFKQSLLNENIYLKCKQYSAQRKLLSVRLNVFLFSVLT